MNKFLLIVTISLFLYTIGFSQTSETKTILEVRRIAGGMVADSGNILFLRITENGEVEYEEAEIKDGKRIFILHKYQISKEKLKEFIKFLDNAELHNAKEVYEPDVPIIDHVIKFDISITQSSKSKNIRLVNYDPTLSDSDDKYPTKLIELFCLIKSFRYKSDFTILGNKCVTIKKIESKPKE